MRILSLVLLAALPFASANAQFIFEHLTPADGLPSDQVLALHEDRDGFIWIGTDGGLARHEGVRIRTWYHDRKDPRSLSNNVIWDITEDEQGVLWIATDHGLSRYNSSDGGFDRVLITASYNDPTSANRIHRIVADGSGLLWLATEDGVHAVSTRTRAQVALPGNAAGSAALTRRSRRFELEADVEHGGVWIGRSNSILFHHTSTGILHDRPHASLPFALLTDTMAQTATPDGAGGLWYFAGGTNELVHLNGAGDILLRKGIDPLLSGICNPQFIAIDRDSMLWLSTWGHELLRLNTRTGAAMTIAPDPAIPWAIRSSNAKSWIQDRDGRIWIGTIDGIDVIDPSRTGIRTHLIRSTNHREVSCIQPINDTLLLLGTEGDGVVVLDRVTGSQRTVASTVAEQGAPYLHWLNFLSGFMPDERGWLIGSHNGLVRLDLSATRLQRATDITSTEPQLARGTVTCGLRTPTGERWVGTWSNGIFKLHPDGTILHFDPKTDHQLPSDEVLSMVAGEQDLWVGFNNGAGLCRIRDDRVVERLLDGTDDGSGYGVVTGLALADDGVLYIGTLMGGLGVRDMSSGRISWYTRSDGLPGDRIEQLVLDKNNALWVRTRDGICRFDRRSHAIHRITLPASMLAMGTLNAIALDTDGSLLCAYGPLVIDLSTTRPHEPSGPEVQLTGLRFGARAAMFWMADSTICLRHDQRALSIEYGVCTYFSGQEIRFAYRVPSLDTAWSSLGTSTRLDLNDLPTGEHHVEVRANNGGSAWTLEPLALKVKVLPPFWATWWFRVLVAGIVVSLVFIAFRVYLHDRLTKERERFKREQAVLSERMRIAGDMHDDLGAGLSGLKLRSEMALRIERDPSKREQLSALASSAGELIGSMRQIIWTMNTDQTSLEDLVVYTTSYVRNYCTENGLAVEVRATGPWPTIALSTEQRRNIFLVVKEALHNVVKHANAGNVRFSMELEQGLTVCLRDDGIGMPKGAELAHGNGLRNMRKRIATLGGYLSIRGTDGTTLFFTVPVVAPAEPTRSAPMSST